MFHDRIREKLAYRRRGEGAGAAFVAVGLERGKVESRGDAFRSGAVIRGRTTDDGRRSSGQGNAILASLPDTEKAIATAAAAARPPQLGNNIPGVFARVGRRARRRIPDTEQKHPGTGSDALLRFLYFIPLGSGPIKSTLQYAWGLRSTFGTWSCAGRARLRRERPEEKANKRIFAAERAGPGRPTVRRR